MARGNKGCDMKIVGLMATHGRHHYCERAVGMFLQQNHPNKHLIILQNSPVPQKLDREYSNITLINEYNFKSLGEIYNRMLDFLPEDTDIVCIFDDDDIFLPNHFSEGELGFKRGEKKAYKPNYSYFVNGNKISPMSNILETSWFVDVNVIKKLKFKNECKAHHSNWIHWLKENKELYVDLNGPKTMGCVWVDVENRPQTCHSSALGGTDEEHFNFFRKNSSDHGDMIISPWTPDRLNFIYDKFKNIEKVGVFVATNCRPIMARLSALQFEAQTKKPDLVCMHQNGDNSKLSYKNFVEDLKLSYKLEWIHTPRTLHQDEWFSIPVRHLLMAGCDYMFWGEDDDIYYSHHIESSIELMKKHNADMIIRNVCDCVKVYDKSYEVRKNSTFTAHADVGVTCSIGFTSEFAEEFLKDCDRNIKNKLEGNPWHQFTDQLINRVTATKFKRYIHSETSTCYVIHRGSFTSAAWL